MVGGRVTAPSIDGLEWVLQKRDGFEEVIWTDEKWFVLNSVPNKQNERFWGIENPKVSVNCKEKGAQVMCWAAVVDGRVFSTGSLLAHSDGASLSETTEG